MTTSAAQTTVLITGASSGIGRALARVFAKHGYRLILTARSAHQLNEFADELKTLYNCQATPLVQDLAASDGPRTLYRTLQQQQITIDILVNNAGMATGGLFASTDIAPELQLLNLNIKALTELTHYLLPAMRNQQSGKILNIASIAAFVPGPFMAVYYASKAYVLSFSQALTEELRGSGVSVTTLCPGVTATHLFQDPHFKTTRLHQHLAHAMTADSVAESAYRGLLNNQRLVIPGYRNKFIRFMLRLIPVTVAMRLIRRQQEIAKDL